MRPGARIKVGIGWTLAIVALTPALWHIASLAHVLVLRVGFPLDLEWLESGQIYQVYRVLHGLPLYTRPDVFVPYPYPPGYFIAVASLGAVTRLDFWTARAVSDVCLVGVLVIQAFELRRLGLRWYGAALAVLVTAGVAASYPLVGGSFDLARADTMNVALAALAATLVSEHVMSTARVVGISAVLTAAVYTKQTNVFFAAWIVLYVIARQRRAGLMIAAVTFTLCAALLSWLEWSTQGWFVRWIFSMRNHVIVWEHLTEGIHVAREGAPFIVIIPVVAGGVAFVRRLRARTVLWLGLAVAAVPAAFLPMIEEGGWVNSMTPLLVFSWIAAALLVGDIDRGLGRTRSAVGVRAFVLAGAWWHLHQAEWSPGSFVPSAQRWADAEALHAFVRALPGDVAMPTYPFVPVRDGKSTAQMSLIACFDASQRGRGIVCDHHDAILATGAEWVLFGNLSYELRNDTLQGYTLVREVDLDFAILTEHSGEGPKRLWHRNP